MKTSAILLSTLFVFALSTRGATTLESGEFAMDLRENPRVSAGTETLTYSTRWAGADALAGCTRKARLAVAGYAGAETLEDVPVLVRISTAIQGFDYGDFAAPATGADLVFCDESETTVYPHEIDEWNTNGESLVWVRLPALAAGTAFKMGYGGSAASAADRAAAAHAVWTDYAGVWHMNEDSGTAFDSTANGLDATPAVGTKGNASTLSEMVAYEAGACGRARVNDAVDRTTSTLTGSGNHLEVPSSAALSLGSHFTFSGWFYSGSMTNCPRVVSRKDEYRSDNGWEIQIANHPTRLGLRGASNSPTLGGVSIPDLRNGWVQLLAVFDGAVVSCYTNGALAASGAITPATDNNLPLVFGSDSDRTETSFHGQYDEIRLRGGSLSSARIRADYDMVANSGFVTIGAVESAIGGPVVSAEIRLDGEVFAGNLSGEGTVDWTPTAPGTYEFQHVSRLGGETIAVETATFVVPGTEPEDLSILAEGDLTEGATIRLGGAADGWTIHYTTNGSTPTAESPAYTGPFALAESATVKVVAVSDAHGWTSGVAEQRFDLAPPLAVTGARARQRYPWNGLVDIDFTLEGDAARRYRVEVEATDLGGGTNLLAATVWKDGGAVTNSTLDLSPGEHRLVWSAGADLPEGFVADNVAVSLRAEPVHDTALYMVVDLSGGPDAERYPVSYLPDVPEGGWTDEFKTDKLVLRRVEPGWFTMGSPEDELGRYVGRENLRDVSLTKPLMAAVFETTQRQFELVAGTNCAHFVGANKPVDNVPLALVRGDGVEFDWPTVPQALSDSFVGRLSRRSGLRSLDLPTEAQWEYVCRAGTRSALNNGGEGDSEYAKLGLFNAQATSSNDGYATVGEYMPNAWDVYDMHGNVYERCLDWFEDSPTGNTDPVGPVTGEARVKKGGSWYAGYRWGRSAHRDPTIYGYNAGIGDYWYDVGFRLFLHDAPAVIEAPIVAPEGLTATTNRTGDVALSWEPVAGAYAYQIRRSKTGAFEDGTWLNTVTNTTYADWTAESRADYAYWVRAQFESGRVGEWSEVAEGCRHKYYSVHFNANGGTGTMVDLELRFDQPQALTANAFTKSGAVFAGWALSAGGSSVYADGETVENLTLEPGATVVLYAVWASSSYTVKFNKNASAASGTMADQTMTRNANAALRANAFVRAGYKFAGWATSASGAKVYNDKQSVKNITTDSSITLYAVWEALTAQNGLYMVIDLSGGANASSYPVSYLSAVPSGGWSTTYKTTKMVLRRINPGTFSMCGQYTTTLTEPYYIGVFEVTEKQYKLITGSNPSQVSQYYSGDTLPVNAPSYNMLRGTSNGAKWPASSAVDSSSTIGKIRTRTGMPFDLPTEAQWEYACRAGTTSSFNNGGESLEDAKKVGCYEENAPYWDKDGYWGQRENYVGSYKANAWGLYDMHGNLAEWCLDWYVKNLSSPQTDPKGPSSGTKRVVRGGTYYWHYYDATSSSREGNISTPGYETSIFGFRLSVTVK